MSDHNLIPLMEYAARIGKAVRTVQQKCQLGHLPGAGKISEQHSVQTSRRTC